MPTSDVDTTHDPNTGIAHVTGRVLTRGVAAAQRALDLAAIAGNGGGTIRRLSVLGPDAPWAPPPAEEWQIVEGVSDPVSVVRALRSTGATAQLDHVLTGDGWCASPCGCRYGGAHGDNGWFGGDPFRANPFRANPLRANPLRANPLRANPMRANPLRANLAQVHVHPTHTAVPADTPELVGPAKVAQRSRIVVLDTGLAGGDHESPARPPLLRHDRITGIPESPLGPNGEILPAAGHGTFIAGLIEQRWSCSVDVRPVMTGAGLVRESDLRVELEALLARPPDERPHVVTMSFSGPTLDEPDLLAEIVAIAELSDVVLVASAGNDGLCRPYYPAAFETVVAVAALDECGPAPFTNFGPWVDAAAPGTDLVSSFFVDTTIAAHHFDGWASWSGSSFSVPLVAARIVRRRDEGRLPPGSQYTPLQARNDVLGDSRAPHVDCLGTIFHR